MKRSKSAEILLIEDNRHDAELVMITLAELGLDNRTTWLQNGKEALNFLGIDGKCEEKKLFTEPRLILLDLHMPLVDGFEFLRKLRNCSHSNHIPVSVFTSSKAEQSVIESLELGVDQYIEKPTDFDQFSASVKEIVGVALRNRINQLPPAVIHNLRTRKVSAITSDLKQSERRFKSLVEHASGLITVVDFEGMISFMSENCKTLLCINPEDLNRRNFFELLHPEDKEMVIREFSKIRSKKTVEIKAYRIAVPGKGWNWFHSIITNMYAEPSIAGNVINSRNITELVQKEKDLQLSNQRYRIASLATQDLIYDWDLQKKAIHRDGGALKNIFGHDIELANQFDFWKSHIHPDDVNEVYQTINEKLKNKNENFYDLEYRFLKADGTYAHVYENGYIIRDKHNKPLRLVGATRDITIAKNRAIQKDLMISISKSMNQPDAELKTCLTNVLQHLVGFTEAFLGEAWLPYLNQAHMTLIASFPASDNASRVSLHPETASYKKGTGIPGIIFESQTQTSFIRAKKNLKLVKNDFLNKIKTEGAYGFPIVYNDQIICILVFYFRKDQEGEQYKHFITELSELLAPELQRKRTKDELDTFFRVSTDIMCIRSADGVFLKVNPAFTQILGYAKEEILNRKIEAFMHPDDLELAQEELLKLTRERSTHYSESRYIAKNGAVKWLSWSSSFVEEENLIVATAKDTTDQKNLQQTLLENSIQSQEKERNRIAKDLHDSIVQELVGCGMKSENIKEYIDNKMELEKQLRELAGSIRKIAMDTRNISHNLASPDIRNTTFEDLIEQFYSKLTTSSDIDFQTSIHISPDLQLNEEVKVNLFRCLQELTSNILKHSKASHASVSIENISEMLYVTVRDNGAGIPTENDHQGIGLTNVKSRINAIGGKISFRSPKNGGVEIHMEVPFRKEGDTRRRAPMDREGRPTVGR